MNFNNFIYLFLIIGQSVYGTDVADMQRDIEYSDIKDNLIYGQNLQNLFDLFFKWVHNFMTANDPYNLDYAPMNINNILCKSKGFVNNVIISDISRINIVPLVNKTNNPNVLYFGLFINSETFQVIGNYSLDFSFMRDVFQLNGNGQFGVAASGLNVSIEMYVWVKYDGGLFIKWTRVKYDIDNLQIQIDGLYNGSPLGKLMSNIFNSTVIKILQQYKYGISMLISLITDIVVNLNLHGLTLNTVINFIQHIIGQ